MMTRWRWDAVVFDLDGTLADSAADIAEALGAAFAASGLSVVRPIAALVDGSPLEEVFAVAVPDAGPEDYDRFASAYRAHYAALEHRQTRLYPGVLDTLESLRLLRPAPRLAVATAKRTRTAEEVLHHLGIAPFFSVVSGASGSSLRHKPAPDLPLAVCAALGVSPRRALMVGDTVRDVEAGRAAGMTTAAVLYGLGDRDALLGAAPDHLLEDMEDLLALWSSASRVGALQ